MQVNAFGLADDRFEFSVRIAENNDGATVNLKNKESDITLFFSSLTDLCRFHVMMGTKIAKLVDSTRNARKEAGKSEEAIDAHGRVIEVGDRVRCVSGVDRGQPLGILNAGEYYEVSGIERVMGSAMIRLKGTGPTLWDTIRFEVQPPF